jgi:hypothetical protein
MQLISTKANKIHLIIFLNNIANETLGAAAQQSEIQCTELYLKRVSVNSSNSKFIQFVVLILPGN